MSTFTPSMPAVGGAFDSPRFGFVQRLAALFKRPVATTPADEIGKFIAENGGVLTDQLERDISRRFGAMAGS